MHTGDKFKYVNQAHYDKLGDVVLDYIQAKMEDPAAFGMIRVPLPLNSETPGTYIHVTRCVHVCVCVCSDKFSLYAVTSYRKRVTEQLSRCFNSSASL